MTDVGDLEHEPLRLPAPASPPPRPPLPLLTALVPVAGAVVLWRATGSVFSLWFAALGPLVALAAFVDGLRAVRRARRAAARQIDRDLARLDGEVDRRHLEERSRAWRRTPDVAALCEDEPEIWRAVPGREDVIVVGRGEGVSALRIDGEAADDTGRALVRRARVLGDAPVTVPVRAGIAVRGPRGLAVPVARALVLQVCLVHPPGRVSVPDPAAAAGLLGVSERLPHAQTTGGLSLVVADAAARVPADADIPIVVIALDAPTPPRCTAVLTLTGTDRGLLDHDGVTCAVTVEALAASQAVEIVDALAERARGLGQRADAATTLDELPAESGAARGLSAAIGVAGGEAFTLDLVEDGPHAVMIGMTGTGKSELLTTWVAAMCRGRGVDQVSLLLVDFKGGRTFDALAALPHVTGVVTDLDAGGALRAVQSLRAEIRRRERVLGRHGARDVDEAGGALPRLVIVVDEYATLVTAHPEVHELFADVAARGRALGLHLILSSQRASGAFRDDVLANAPLRIALRTVDGADSRALLGTDDAARLPARPDARGTALVRRAGDDAPQRVRVARCTPAVLDGIRDSAGPRRARAPWLPPLPSSVPLERVAVAGRIALGLADEPDRQRQEALLLPDDAPGLVILGAAASGRTSLLRAIAQQLPALPVRVPSDPEAAWDTIVGISREGDRRAVLIDDIDALIGRLPADYATEMVGCLERLVRGARADGRTVVVTAARVSGALARVIDLLPHRVLLSLPTRAEHVAAGGDGGDFVRDLPPGRGRWDGMLVQFAHPSAPPSPSPSPREDPTPRSWRPADSPSGVTAAVVGPGGDLRALRESCARHGARLETLGEGAASGGLSDIAGSARPTEPPVVVHGAPEEWLSQWRALADVRETHDLLVGAECLAQFRAITGRRELPPYALEGAGRAWRVAAHGPCERVLLSTR